jgi:hypothetical protein
VAEAEIVEAEAAMAENGGNPQTVNVSVIAQAVDTQSDASNQKIVGPIVITRK